MLYTLSVITLVSVIADQVLGSDLVLFAAVMRGLVLYVGSQLVRYISGSGLPGGSENYQWVQRPLIVC